MMLIDFTFCVSSSSCQTWRMGRQDVWVAEVGQVAYLGAVLSHRQWVLAGMV